MSVDVTSLGVQVHGGMGYIEETGAAQHFRDSRILPIYEGTTAIQANDLVGRKTYRDSGKTAKLIASMILQTEKQLESENSIESKAVLKRLTEARVAFELVIDFILANFKSDTKNVFAGAVNYLRLTGILLSGWQMAKALLVAERKMKDDPKFYSAKIATAYFHAEHLMSQIPGLASSIVEGGSAVNQLMPEQF
jgi:hypothetical protein